MQKKVLINIALGVFLVLSVVFLVATVSGWDYRNLIGFKSTQAEEQPKQVDQPKVETTKARQDILLDDKGKADKYTLIYWLHEMANNLVIAEDDQIWGLREINKENLNIVYNTAKALPDNDSDKERFVAIIEEWQNKNFSKIADEHNTFWLLLGGTVGKASGVNEQAVKDVVSRLK